MANNDQKNETTNETFRTLFIGLGGTGGEVLSRILKMMKGLPDEERSKLIYIDTDQGDTARLRAAGIPAVDIGSSDTVRDIIYHLGEDDGVRTWCPTSPKNKEFLSSRTDDGASQYRLKSRLCMAKFLANPNNELKRKLDEVSVPGLNVEKETLRVIVVSSIAGGTGAGSFVQVALYLRAYFRDNGHNDISITGLFACPDLYAKTALDNPGSREKVENMYGNAYAAIRELNAMNLVVNRDTAQPEQGYGKSIHMEINTRSEGYLFDSTNPLFAASANYKPYNLMYFVDTSNTYGGVLTSIEQYYDVMADIAFTRLFTPMEKDLRSDENNELEHHEVAPTAIYGSAGYSRIVYPYEGILDYLAARKTYDEVDYTWGRMENEWEKYKTNQRLMAKANGRRWSATSAERGKKFVADMQAELAKGSARFADLTAMVQDADSVLDRAEQYLDLLATEMSSRTAFSNEDGDHAYGLWTDEQVGVARADMISLHTKTAKKIEKLNSTDDYYKALREFSKSAKANADVYMSRLLGVVAGRAQLMAGIVAPQNEKDGLAAAVDKNPLNLFYGLLSLDGQAVHPLAARYLLYRLREKMEGFVKENQEDVLISSMRQTCKYLDLALDKVKGDGKDITVDVYINDILKKKTFFWQREGAAKEAMKTYLSAYESAFQELTTNATNILLSAVYTQALKVVNILIEKYEGLFDNLKQFQDHLKLKVELERVAHEASRDDRTLYVGASAEAKEDAYNADRRIRDILSESGDAIADAAGSGIYEALMKRTWKQLEMEDDYLLSDGYTKKAPKDTFSDLTGIFNNVCKVYAAHLAEKAVHMNVDVFKALVNECCRIAGVDEDQLASDAAVRVRVQTLFKAYVDNAISKAAPMLNYENANSDPYFEQERVREELKVSTTHMHLGVNPVTLESIKTLYKDDSNTDPVLVLNRVFNPDRGMTLDNSYDPKTLLCFRAVHCLQPTQIKKFREDFPKGYYPYYKKRLAKMHNTQRMSLTPHLDQRWHLRESMPYISAEMDIAWHKKAAKAFVHEALDRKLCFTTDEDGIVCFTYSRNDNNQNVYVKWPENKLVTISDISRLIEYLREDDERVEAMNLRLDEMLEGIVEYVTKYNESMPVYKRALTTNTLLKDLRTNLIIRGETVSTTTAVRGKKKGAAPTTSAKEQEAFRQMCLQLGIDESEFIDRKKSLGGLMEIAWRVHRSEEKQGRDNDFGECIVECALELAEKLTEAMCGVGVTEDSEFYAEYKDLYNSILEKYMEPFVLYIVEQLKLDPAELTEEGSVYFHRYLKVPAKVLNTSQYKWAARLLALK
ncbi:MAG: hypothetical protein IJN04_04350 [Clostridia bacterium]|nr:hypothetical protein [Clostridia bacterium]